MKRVYAIQHWVLTILIAPLLLESNEYLFYSDSFQFIENFETYRLTLFFSFFISIPTFLVYLSVYYFLNKCNIKFLVSKVILIAVSVLGILITQIIMIDSIDKEITIFYSFTSILVGLILKIRNPVINLQGNINEI